MSNAFEYGDALLPHNEQPQHAEEETEESSANTPPKTPTVETNQPYMNLATYVVTIVGLVYTSQLTFVHRVIIDSVWLSWQTRSLRASLRQTSLRRLS